MPIGQQADFQIYHEQFFGGVTEVLRQNSVAFNEASNGCIQLVPRLLKGEFEQESFFQSISSMVTRRDVASVAAGTSTFLAQGEKVSVKLNRRFQVENTLNSFRKIGESPELMSLLVGRQLGTAITLDYLNSLITGGAAAIPVDAAHEITGGASVTLTGQLLVQGLALFGDASQEIVCWLMHSKPWHDLLEDQITQNILDLTGRLLVTGASPGTIGRPVVRTDSSALVISGVPDRYITIGLTRGAFMALQSEESDVIAETVTGLEQLVGRIQGEHAFNVGIKGHSYSLGAGANPDAATLGNAANWSEVATDIKDTAGVRITTE